MYQLFLQNLNPVMPEFVIIATALIVLLLDLFLKGDDKAVLGWFSLAGVLTAAYASHGLMGNTGSFFDGTFQLDPFSTFFKFVFYLACGLGILLSINYLKAE